MEEKRMGTSLIPPSFSPVVSGAKVSGEAKVEVKALRL
jgi:hypothetical protein